MKFKNIVLIILNIFSINILSNQSPNYKQDQKVYIYVNNSQYYNNIESELKKFNIKFEIVNSITKDDQNLYIIFDIFNIDQQILPKYYIAYQTLDLKNNLLEDSYLKKLESAIAVWDFSRENIKKYNSKIYNYYYFPANYEHADPAILPCFLPINILDTYKELLIYSNRDDTEISSLIPVLFFHGYQQNPKLIAEFGVCLGYSTQAFKAIIKVLNSELLGIDNDPNAAPAYKNLYNATFLLINDLNFAQYYTNSKFKNTPIDIEFIDTSHQYDHTLAEIRQFVPLLSNNGIIMFHDANVTPLIVNGRPAFWRLNDTIQLSCVNPFGVAPAIRDYFGISFDVSKYTNFKFEKNGIYWHFIHYPFCNGLTVIKKI